MYLKLGIKKIENKNRGIMLQQPDRKFVIELDAK